MHPATEQLLRYFAYDHLPPALSEVSEPFHALAHRLVGNVEPGFALEGAEATTALRKLLEAKDCAVRAALDSPATKV